MGLYIEVPKSRNKAEQIVALFDAVIVTPPVAPSILNHSFSGEFSLVCVVQNGFFDAAGVCFDDKEFDEFNDPQDMRTKTWLLIPTVKLLEHLKSRDFDDRRLAYYGLAEVG